VPTFQCDNCGREFPRSQLKEAFTGEASNRTKHEFCPECLDEWMNDSAHVLAVPGEEKSAARFVAEDERVPADQTYGERR
jgi:hypothetical protein